MFGANAFAWPYFGEIWAGITAPLRAAASGGAWAGLPLHRMDVTRATESAGARRRRRDLEDEEIALLLELGLL